MHVKVLWESLSFYFVDKSVAQREGTTLHTSELFEIILFYNIFVFIHERNLLRVKVTRYHKEKNTA